MLNDNTSLYIDQESKLMFEQNSAFVLEGAIYSAVTKSIRCIFELNSFTAAKNVYFHNNTACGIDQSIFIRSADICKNQTDILEQLLIEPNDFGQIMFPPDTLELVLTKSPNETIHESLEVALSEIFYLKPVHVMDQFDNALNDWIGYIRVQPEQVGDFALRGPDTITFDMAKNEFL